MLTDSSEYAHCPCPFSASHSPDNTTPTLPHPLTSSLACARTTSVVVYLLRKMNHHVFCYLDDFVGLAPTEVMAQQAYSNLMQLTNQLGLAMSPDKCHPPAKQIEWLSFIISAEHMMVTIPTPN